MKITAPVLLTHTQAALVSVDGLTWAALVTTDTVTEIRGPGLPAVADALARLRQGHGRGPEAAAWKSLAAAARAGRHDPTRTDPVVEISAEEGAKLAAEIRKTA